jgi:ABC-type proline/glycine betaine transport system ATPase subunit
MTKAELNEKHHGHVLGLNDINISMPAGQIQVIMGLSGSGKSTLIRHINRLIDPTAGEVMVGGENVVTMSPTSCANSAATDRDGVPEIRAAAAPHRAGKHLLRA